MHVRIVWGKIKSGMWDEYRKWYTDKVIPSTDGAKGLRGRRLVRSVDDPDEGISVTFWDTLEDLDACERSEARQGVAREAAHLYAGEYLIKHFEQEYDDP